MVDGQCVERDRCVDKLSSKFQLIVYDRRESGKSAGRVEKLTWDLYARQAKGLLDHLNIDSAFVLGGCMGSSSRATMIPMVHPQRII
jgi:pimeloyl-ACP methyl ester carboxylesterase